MNSQVLTQLTAEEELFRDAVRDFARSEIGPRVKEMDVREKFDPDLLRQFFELNLMGIQIPQQWGGAEGSFFMSVLAVEELSRVDPSAAVIVDVQNTLVNNALLNWGSQAQKSRFLPRLATGSVGAYALSEAAAGSDAFALRTRAVERDGAYFLSGQKLWTTNALEADFFIVFATLDPSLGYRGITAFLVEKDFPGFSVGKKEEKLGIRASSTCESSRPVSPLVSPNRCAAEIKARPTVVPVVKLQLKGSSSGLISRSGPAPAPTCRPSFLPSPSFWRKLASCRPSSRSEAR